MPRIRSPRVPDLAAGLALPFARGHQPVGFAEHVQGDFLAETEATHEGVQAVDPQLVREVVEIGVVGPVDRRLQAHPAIAVAVPVTVLVVVVGQLVVAGVEDPRGRRDHPGVEAGQRHRRLHRRARRIEPAQDAVVQRPVDGVTQLGIGLEADAGDEQVRVVARLADHRQHVAGGRLDRHDGAPPPGQGVLGGLLQAAVDAQDDVLAGNRVGALEHPQHPPAGVGLDFLVANRAVQLALVEALDAGLADMVGAAVVDRVEVLQFLLVDPPDVPDRMGKVLLQRVVADELGRHVDARQAELVHRDAGDLFLVEFEHDGNRLERTPPLLHALLEDGPVVLGQAEDLHQRVEGLLQVLGAFAGDGQAEARPVVGDDHAVAVEDDPAGRRDRLHMDPVVLRQRRMVLVLGHLQVVHARHQHQGQQDHRHRPDDDAPTHQAGVFLVVFQVDRLRHRDWGLFVVGVPGQYGPGPVDLLADQDPHQRVRQRQRRQRPALLAARADLRRQPFRAADHEIHGACVETPAIQFASQLLGAPGPTFDLQGHHPFPGCTRASMASPS